MLVPTLDGPRVEFYHRVPVHVLEAAWPGEKLAILWMGKSYISPLVPDEYLRYVFVKVRHFNSSWCHSSAPDVKRLTAGAPHHRAVEIELALALHDLGPKNFDRYWKYRRCTCRSDFFKRGAAVLRGVKRRLRRLATLWDSVELPRGISSWEEFRWPLGLAMMRYRAIRHKWDPIKSGIPEYS